ncbi:MAG: hypothetical protein ABMA15_18925, partial [Vicinamibacterales bacterium]
MGTPQPLDRADREFVDRLTRFTLIILIVGQSAAGYTDSDIWGHMAIGLDTLSAGHLLRVDPYSFTHDQPWINHEWLWDVIVATAYRAGGLRTLVVLKVALVGAVLWYVHRASDRAPGWVRTLTLCVVGIACIGQWRSLRPQMATLALYAALLSHIDAWWLPLLFVLWANVHGGWVFGLAALAVHTAMHPTRKAVLITGLSAAATLLNPYGLHLWFAIADAAMRGWADVTEWQPIWRIAAGPEALVIWLAVAGFTAFLWRRLAPGPVRGWVWMAVTLAAAANSRRLSALAAVTSALQLATLPQLTDMPVVRWTALRRGVAGGLIASAFAWGVIMLRPTADCFPPLPEWRAPEPSAVEFLRTTSATRLVPHFDYGEYAFFFLRDRMKVAIDNRRETVYSADAIQANQRFTEGRDPEYPDRIGADAVWWPVSGT